MESIVPSIHDLSLYSHRSTNHYIMLNKIMPTLVRCSRGTDSALRCGMNTERDVRACRSHEQLTLALAVPTEDRRPGASVVPGHRRHGFSVLRSRRLHPGGATAPSVRIRKTPSRDSRGRFVAFATTTAPSWFVFCCDGYRIRGEASETPVSTSASIPVPARPPKRRFFLHRAEIENLALMLVFFVACFLYRLHLQVAAR